MGELKKTIIRKQSLCFAINIVALESENHLAIFFTKYFANHIVRFFWSILSCMLSTFGLMFILCYMLDHNQNVCALLA